MWARAAILKLRIDPVPSGTSWSVSVAVKVSGTFGKETKATLAGTAMDIPSGEQDADVHVHFSDSTTDASGYQSVDHCRG